MTHYEDEIAAAYTLMNQGDMDEALEHVLKAIGHESKKAEAYALASHIYGCRSNSRCVKAGCFPSRTE